jgi:polyisoprenoid-binding protein YceI
MRYIFLIAISGLLACQQAPRADKAEISEAQSVQAGEGIAYQLDTAQSRLQWIGTKPTGKHTGIFKLQSGTLFVKDSAITGGKFVMDMESLHDVDLASDTAMKNKLERELKSPLFFDTQQYPTATFAITGISVYRPTSGSNIMMTDATHTIRGNLTIKNVTKNITFPVRISISEQELTASANFNMDRTLWGMAYRADKSLQDKLINSMVNISFNIRAVR